MVQTESGQPLEELPNLGLKSAELLRAVGISTGSELCKIGSVGAALRIADHRPDDPPCRSMLCGLEGAIRSVRWHAIPKTDRDRLWREYQAARAEEL